MTGAPLHDPWLNPADEHFGGCDGKCHAGLCEERERVLAEAADEDGEAGDDVVGRLRLAAKPEEIASVWGLTVVRCSLLREAADEIKRQHRHLTDCLHLIRDLQNERAELEAQVDRLLTEGADEIERLRGFFWEFGTHQNECEAHYSNTCDCGWDIAVATLPDGVA